MTTPRASRLAAELRQRGVPVRDVEVLDALLGLIDDDREAEAEFIAWLAGDEEVRAGELADAMIARGAGGSAASRANASIVGAR